MSRFDEIRAEYAKGLPLHLRAARYDMAWLIDEVEELESDVAALTAERDTLRYVLSGLVDATRAGPDFDEVAKFLHSAKRQHGDGEFAPILDEYTAWSFAYGIRYLWRKQTKDGLAEAVSVLQGEPHADS